MPEADAAGTPPQQDDDPPPTQGEQSLERDAADDAGSVAVVHLEPQALWQQVSTSKRTSPHLSAHAKLHGQRLRGFPRM